MDLILLAAEEEFKRGGFAGSTTAAIAARAGVTETQLFRYFASKADLFREAIFTPLNRHFSDFNTGHLRDAAQSETHREKVRQYTIELQHFIDDHSKMLLSLIVARTYAPETTGAGQIDSLQTYFERGAAMMAGRIGSEPAVDPKLMVRVSFAAVLGSVLFKDWLFPEGLATDDQISAAIIDFVLDGINANAGTNHDA